VSVCGWCDGSAVIKNRAEGRFWGKFSRARMFGLDLVRELVYFILQGQNDARREHKHGGR